MSLRLNGWLKKVLLTLIGAWAPILLIAGIFEYFGRKRMGFMRFLVYMRNEYSQTWLSPDGILLIKSILFIGTIVALFSVLKSRPKPAPLLVSLFMTQAVTIDFMLSESFVNFKSAPFILLACICSIFIQFCVICYKNFIKK